MLRPHVIIGRPVLTTCYSLSKVLHSSRVSFITLSYILLWFCRFLAFFLVPGMSHQCISPIHQNLAIMLYDIQRLLLMLPHVLLMPELYLKHPNPIQGLLQQLLRIIFLLLSYSIAPGTLSRGVVQISYLLHAVFAYSKSGGNQRV